MLAEEGLNAQKVVDPWSFEFQNSGNSSEFLRIILCNVRVGGRGSKLASMCAKSNGFSYK